MAAGRYDAARRQLVRLSPDPAGRGEVEYQLGLCELHRCGPTSRCRLGAGPAIESVHGAASGRPDRDGSDRQWPIHTGRTGPSVRARKGNRKRRWDFTRPWASSTRSKDGPRNCEIPSWRPVQYSDVPEALVRQLRVRLDVMPLPLGTIRSATRQDSFGRRPGLALGAEPRDANRQAGCGGQVGRCVPGATPG